MSSTTCPFFDPAPARSHAPTPNRYPSPPTGPFEFRFDAPSRPSRLAPSSNPTVAQSFSPPPPAQPRTPLENSHVPPPDDNFTMVVAFVASAGPTPDDPVVTLALATYDGPDLTMTSRYHETLSESPPRPSTSRGPPSIPPRRHAFTQTLPPTPPAEIYTLPLRPRHVPLTASSTTAVESRERLPEPRSMGRHPAGAHQWPLGDLGAEQRAETIEQRGRCLGGIDAELLQQHARQARIETERARHLGLLHHAPTYGGASSYTRVSTPDPQARAPTPGETRQDRELAAARTIIREQSQQIRDCQMRIRELETDMQALRHFEALSTLCHKTS